MNLEPAHSFAQGLTRVVILLVWVIGFFAAGWIGFRLGGDHFTENPRAGGLPFALAFMVYMIVAAVVGQFWY